MNSKEFYHHISRLLIAERLYEAFVLFAPDVMGHWDFVSNGIRQYEGLEDEVKRRMIELGYRDRAEYRYHLGYWAFREAFDHFDRFVKTRKVPKGRRFKNPYERLAFLLGQAGRSLPEIEGYAKCYAGYALIARRMAGASFGQVSPADAKVIEELSFLRDGKTPLVILPRGVKRIVVNDKFLHEFCLFAILNIGIILGYGSFVDDKQS